MTTIIFLIVLSILIFVHELGHFLVARFFNIRVDEFAIGFPPRLFAFKKGETTYAINLIPLGGYVKIYGENPDDAVTSDSILSKPRWQQALVLIAGVTFNAIFALILFAGVFMFGSKAQVGDFPIAYSGPATIMITGVTDNSPASHAGLIAGDEILAVATGVASSTYNFATTSPSAQRVFAGNPFAVVYSTTTSAALTVESVRESIILSTTTLALVIERSGEIKTVVTIPTDGINGVSAGKKGLGILMSQVATVKLPFFKAIGAGFEKTIAVIREISVSTYDFLGRAFTGNAKMSEVSGPVGIAGHVGEAARLGFAYLAAFSAFISLNLAVLNLLPIPALDGGRLLFVIIESIIRRPLPAKITQWFNVVSFVLLIGLMLFVTFKDVLKLFN